MFNWNVENMSLKNGSKINGLYHAEYTTSREDKLAFIDGMQDGKLSYIISIIKRFEKEKNQLPTYSNGRYNVKSFRSWIKRNDPRNLIDSTDAYSDINGYFSLCGWGGAIQNSYIKDDNVFVGANINLIDKCFHNQLAECERMEYEYFAAHDEYSILLTQIIEGMRRYRTSFGVRISTNNSKIDPEVWIHGDAEDNACPVRMIRLDEARILVERYKELEAFIGKLSSDINITYDGGE